MEQKTDRDRLAVNIIRMLANGAIQKARSGHPGSPMVAAATAYALWQRVLRYGPEDAGGIQRGRFLLSSRDASMLLYGLIDFAGITAVAPSYEP